MRDPKRIDQVLEALRAAWHRAPDCRLGQLMINLSNPRDWSDMWNMEDDVWEKRIKLFAETGTFFPTPGKP